jgi:hypothetical protein
MAGCSSEVDTGVEELTKPEVLSERGHLDEPGVGDDVVVVEAHLNPVQAVRRCAHRKGAFRLGAWFGFSTTILPGRRALFADAQRLVSPETLIFRWIQV